jgi:heme/copper-type cytochrome/quinol oxidase subunit 2
MWHNIQFWLARQIADFMFFIAMVVLFCVAIAVAALWQSSALYVRQKRKKTAQKSGGTDAAE